MPDILSQLNKQQKQAVQHDSGPLLIIAGAGTGKTTVVTSRIAHLIMEKNIKPDEILALTFTEKAAQEMEDRVEIQLPYGYVDLWISTFHSFAERILHDHALDIGLPPQFKLATVSEQWSLLRKHMDELELDYYRPLGNPTKFLHELIRHFSRAKDEDIWPDDYLKYAEGLKLDSDATPDQDSLAEKDRVHEIARVYKKYEQILLQQGVIDFGDLILYTLKLFRTRPKILDMYRKKFKYILVDEFQDTNYAQYELIRLLAEPKNNLTVVADDDQSIYKFRGASVSNVLQFKEDYPHSKEISLIENYRSTQNILDTAYNFIQLNNPDRLETKIGINKKLHSQTDAQGIIEHIHAPTLEQEAREVAKRIARIKKENPETPLSDFAVLVRANDQADIFMQTFEKANIPYQFVASRGLYLKPEIIDIFSYLKLLDNYHESRALFRVLNMSLFHIPHEDVVTLLTDAKKFTRSVYETLKISQTLTNISEKGREGIAKILSLIEKHSQSVREQKPVGQVVFQFLEDSGILQYYTHLPEGEANYKLNLLRQLFKNIESFERASEDKTIKAFLEYVDFALDAGDTGSMSFDADIGPETVKIMTVHTSKGLEFPYVFVANMVDKRFPSISRKDLIELPSDLVKEVLNTGDVHLQEERRLFYVACTRAKKGLFFTSADDYGGTRKKKVSRFLVESGIAEQKKTAAKKGDTLLDPGPKMTDKKFVYTHVVMPAKLSFTQLKAYETCPYQYRFAHVLGVPVKGSHTFSFGKTIHATLQQFFQAMLQKKELAQRSLFPNTEHQAASATQIPTYEDLLEMYENAWIQEWYPSKTFAAEYKLKGKKFLKEFYEKHTDNWPKVLYLEKGFTVKIGDFAVKGFIDRVDTLGDNKVEVIDYKTGSTPKKPKPDNEQLMIYAIALKEVMKHDPESVAFYYVGTNEKQSYDVTDERMEEVKAWVEDIAMSIKKGDFTPKPGFACKHCDFKDICEYKKV